MIPNFRPHVTVHPYYWMHRNGTRVDGIGLFHGATIVAHLTDDEAIRLADLLVDLVEQKRLETNHEQQEARVRTRTNKVASLRHVQTEGGLA